MTMVQCTHCWYKRNRITFCFQFSNERSYLINRLTHYQISHVPCFSEKQNYPFLLKFRFFFYIFVMFLSIEIHGEEKSIVYLSGDLTVFTKIGNLKRSEKFSTRSTGSRERNQSVYAALWSDK